MPWGLYFDSSISSISSRYERSARQETYDKVTPHCSETFSSTASNIVSVCSIAAHIALRCIKQLSNHILSIFDFLAYHEMSYDSSIFSLLNLVESVDKITTSAVAQRVGKCEMSAWNRGIMIRIEGLLKHASSEFAKLMNDCLTINRIPPDILAHIFTFVGRGAPVIKASHVCKWWRQISISSPTLWTLYRTRQPPRLEAVIQRSRDALLDVHVRISNEESIWSLLPLRSQVGRLRVFDIEWNHDHFSGVAALLVELFPLAAPQLTQLSVNIGKQYHYRNSVPPRDTNSSWFSPLFGGDMPRLRLLRLIGADIWPQFSGPNLQSLILVNITLPLHTLMSVLHAVPNLEVLALDVSTFSGTPTRPGPVTMERLRMLHIDAVIRTDNDLVHLYYFVSSLSMQKDIVMHLEVSHHNRQLVFSPELASGWHNSNCFEFIDCMHTLYLATGEVTVFDNKSFFTYEPSVLCGNHMGYTTNGILFEFFHCRLTYVTNLTIQCSIESLHDPNLDLPMMLGLMPSLENLTVLDCRDWDDQPYSLFDILLQDDPITGVPCYAPRLAKITMIFPFGGLSESPNLIKLLRGRYASGYPIKLVQFVTYDVDNTQLGWVQEIRKYVQDVFFSTECSFSYCKPPIPDELLKINPKYSL